ncbi:uracil-DNA glycosylase [Solimonas terrae]|uniref:Type-4 uracil-DNA glycosylase n=1 Tax=Solimonas terrae TaxID=1396819 RepID=A0A6M2BLR6_9GAMM|nr:uracil-DNA glycosylase [Solimonas terrae]
MDSARRQRYLRLMGIDVWRLRGAEAAEPFVDVAPGAAEAPQPKAARPERPAPRLPPPAAPVRLAVGARSAPPVIAAAPAAEHRPAASPAIVVPSDWPGLRAAVKDCMACKLCATRSNTVFGVGSETAPLMIVGEGPGADEDARGEPFVGRAGQLLDQMLKSIGRDRRRADAAEAVFIANVVKCRPPGNRDPEADEVDACRPYLDRQIELVRPKLIVALGRIAAQRLLNSDAPLSKLRGPLYHYGARRTPLLVTYHPAYLLRSPREKAKSWADLKKIHQQLGAVP